MLQQCAKGAQPLVLDMTQNFPADYSCIGKGKGCSGGVVAYPLNVTSIPTQAVWPYVQQWSASVQRMMPKGIVATLAYVGSKGTHLTVERQLNQLVPVDPSQNPFVPGLPITASLCAGNSGNAFQVGNTLVLAGDPGYDNLVQACNGTVPGRTVYRDPNSERQFAPGFGQIFSLENVANSHYNALQVTARRTAGPLNLDVVYSYGKSADDASDRFDTTLVNSFNLNSNYAASNFDQRHLLNVGYVYQLPNLIHTIEYLRKILLWSDNPSDSAYQPSPFAKKIIEGWELSGVTSVQSGTPFSVINGGSPTISVLDNAGVANGIGAGSYPDVIGLPSHPYPLPQGGNNAKSFGPLLANPNDFAAPEGLTFGNAGRNVMRNPRRTNFDMALLKNYKLRENLSLELRGEAFNVFNHTQFRIYNPDRGNTGTNVINCYGGSKFSAGFVDPNGGTNCLLGSSFLHPVDAHRPRTIQFGAKLIF